MNDKGFDVSHHNVGGKPLDFAAAKAAGYKFCVIKATDGLGHDPMFVQNAQGAIRAGMVWSAYHFFRPEHSPIDQATNFIATIKQVGGFHAMTMPPVVDVEDPSDDLGAWHREFPTQQAAVAALGGFLQTVDLRIASIFDLAWFTPNTHKGEPRRCFIYASVSGFWVPTFGGADFSGHPLWAARYGHTPDLTGSCWENKGWAIWQDDDHGSVPGIGNGSVDTNQWNGVVSL